MTLMSAALLVALGIPILYLVVTTGLLVSQKEDLPRWLQRLSNRDALLWNTMVGILIAVGALRWALNR